MGKAAAVFSLAFIVSAAVLTSAARLKDDPFALPEDLLIGAGVSAIQTEGAWDADGKKESSADHLLHTGKLGPLGFEDPHQHDVAADSYHRYKDDIAMAKQLGLKLYRFSISWGRLFYEGQPIQAGVDFYNNFIDEIIAAGMKPLATLYHFDHPQEYETQFKGWQSPKMVDKFVQYAEFVFKTYGKKVDMWVTMNEPNMYCAYFPSMFVQAELYKETDINIYECMRNLVVAHAKSYRSFKKTNTGQLGFTALLMHASPNTTQPEDIFAAQLFNEVHAGQTLSPVVHGDFPQILKDNLADKLIPFSEDEKTIIKGSTDFIGFNIYFSMVATYKDPKSGTPNSNIPIMGKLVEDLPMVALSMAGGVDKTNPMAAFSRIAPEAIRDAVLWAWESYKMPIVVTENGLGDTLGLGIHDELRAAYHSAYLRELVATAKTFDVKVLAYCAWSMIDSFEWSAGFGRPFGLVHVDFENKTLDRSLKDSSKFWIELAKTRVVPYVAEPTTPAPPTSAQPTAGPTAAPAASTTPKPSSAAFASACLFLQVSAALICLAFF